MRRLFLVSAMVLAIAGLLVVTMSSIGAKPLFGSGNAAPAQGSHTITITPWGPDQATIDAVKGSLARHPAVEKYLKGTRNRMLYFEFVDPETKPARSEPPSRYRATFYDYTNNRPVVIDGRFADANFTISTPAFQPNPSPEEFEAAVAVLARDSTLGPAIRNNSLVPYPPMPPLVEGGAKGERTVGVGLLPQNGKAGNEVVGVNMVRESVVRYASGAPVTSAATEINCGAPNAGQGSTSRGTAGQFEMIISRDGQEIWRMIVIRPSASSGSNASGIELRDVNFLGKRVFARAHAPILNVQYERNSCGPFRDWSWQEGMFEANGTDVAGTNGGIRICTSNPQTVLDSGVDFGNFRGVAVFDNREEVRLTSELNAGWYRYISEWSFHDNGIIQPIFGYGATQNSCVCRIHTHHVYWRFDFDIITAANNNILERTDETNFKIREVEERRLRDGGDFQQWLVQNDVTGEGVLIVPGHRDGNADKYGKADLWFLRFKSTEIDDGPGSSDARLDPFANGESIVSQDIVLWYAGHWRHDHFDRPEISHGVGPNVHGPELRLQRY